MPRCFRNTTRALDDAARVHRRQMTRAESVLWNALRRKRLNGLRFRRQHALGPYVLDFCCSEHRLVIEVDEAHHEEQQEYDQGRTEHLEQYGYQVLRFRNEEVIHSLGDVLSTIAATTEAREHTSEGTQTERWFEIEEKV